MKRSKFALALLAAVSLSPCAEASVFSLGTFGDTNVLFGFDFSGPIHDIYQFTLAGKSNITDSFVGANIADFSYSLSEVAPTPTALGTHASYSGLGAGKYDFAFSGLVPSFPIPLGIYFGDYTVAAAGAVPELDTWLMLLVGAGLTAFQLRRRQNTLRHSQLEAV